MIEKEMAIYGPCKKCNYGGIHSISQLHGFLDALIYVGVQGEYQLLLKTYVPKPILVFLPAKMLNHIVVVIHHDRQRLAHYQRKPDKGISKPRPHCLGQKIFSPI